MIKLLIYDLDGTLIDSREDIANAVNAALAALRLPPLPKHLICTFVGNGVTHLIRKSLEKAGSQKNQLEDGIRLYRDHYSKHLLDHTRLYPSAKPVLEYFKDRKQGVITNKPEDFSNTILNHLGVYSYFFRVTGGDSKFQKKPSPEAVIEMMAAVGAERNETVLIGDSAIDVETGKNAGVKTIAVTYGFGTLEEIQSAGPDVILNDLSELKKSVLYY